MREPYPRPLPPSSAWPACRPHPATFAVLLPVAAAALLYYVTRGGDTWLLVGAGAGLVTCLGITLPARVHLRALTPFPGRDEHGQLFLINEGPGVQTLIDRVRDPEAQLHRDISFSYLLAPGVILPLSALLITASLMGYDGLALGVLYGLVAGLALTLSLRPLRATWWALRHHGTVLDPRSVAPLLAAHAAVHGEHTVYGGVTAEAVNATLADHPDLAANANDVCVYFGGRRGRWPHDRNEPQRAEPPRPQLSRGEPAPPWLGPVPFETASPNRPLAPNQKLAPHDRAGRPAPDTPGPTNRSASGTLDPGSPHAGGPNSRRPPRPGNPPGGGPSPSLAAPPAAGEDPTRALGPATAAVPTKPAGPTGPTGRSTPTEMGRVARPGGSSSGRGPGQPSPPTDAPGSPPGTSLGNSAKPPATSASTPPPHPSPHSPPHSPPHSSPHSPRKPPANSAGDPAADPAAGNGAAPQPPGPSVGR